MNKRQHIATEAHHCAIPTADGGWLMSNCWARGLRAVTSEQAREWLHEAQGDLGDRFDEDCCAYLLHRMVLTDNTAQDPDEIITIAGKP